MQIEINYNKVNYILTLFIALVFLFIPRFVSLLISLSIINFLAALISKQINFLNGKINLLFLFPVIWFILHVFALFYSDIHPESLSELGTKLSFILLPLIYFSLPLNTKEQVPNILKVFVFSNVIGILYSFSRATYDYFIIGISNFSYEKFAHYIDINPAYFTVYIGFSLFILIYLLLETKTNKLIYIASLIILFIGMILLSSRMAILVNLILLTGYIIIYSYKKRFLMKGIIVLTIFLGLIGISIYKTESINKRFAILFSSKNTFINNVRTKIWHAGLEVIKEKPIIGHGISNSQNKLIDKYKEFGYLKPLEKNYNYHNQYLQSWATLGIIGLLTLILMMFYPIFYNLTRYKIPIISLMLLLIMNMMTESYFQTERGIVFFMLFYSILLSSQYEEGVFKNNY